MNITPISLQNQNYKKQSFGNFRPIHERNLDWLKETFLQNDSGAIAKLEEACANATTLQAGKTPDTKFFLGDNLLLSESNVPVIDFIDKNGNTIKSMRLHINNEKYSGIRDGLEAIIAMISDSSQKVLGLSK